MSLPINRAVGRVLTIRLKFEIKFEPNNFNSPRLGGKEPIMANKNEHINGINKFAAELAEKHSLSRLCVGRTKLDTSDAMGVELTIEDCDLAQDVVIDGEQTTFSVYTFKEFPGQFMYGGMKLTAMAPDIINIAKRERMTIADLDIHIMLVEVQTKSKKSFTDVKFI